jgi:signal transduction histidine kinase
VAQLAALVPTSRSRLARELHDTVGQSINALLMEIRVAIDRGQAGLDDLLILEQEAEAALQHVRALAYRVRRRAMSDPLLEAKRYGERLVALGGAGFRWIDQRTNPQLARKVAGEIASIIRESVTNAVRHAGAALVEVKLTEADGRVRVTIRDDGTGFSPMELKPSADGRGLGLLGNSERMAELGGVFTVRSRPGDGTVVVLEAPRYVRRSAPERLHQSVLPIEPSPLTTPAAAVAAG